MWDVHQEIKQVNVSPATIQAAVDGLRQLLASADPHSNVIQAYGLPYYANVMGIAAEIGYLQNYGVSNEDINTLIDASTLPGLHLPPTPGLSVEVVATTPPPVYPIDPPAPPAPTLSQVPPPPAPVSTITNPTPATTKVADPFASSIPIIGPIVNQVAALIGINPIFVWIGGGLLGAWALGVFDEGGRR